MFNNVPNHYLGLHVAFDQKHNSIKGVAYEWQPIIQISSYRVSFVSYVCVQVVVVVCVCVCVWEGVGGSWGLVVVVVVVVVGGGGVFVK